MRRSSSTPFDYALLVISDSDQDWQDLKTNYRANECMAWTWTDGTVTTKVDESGRFLSDAKIVFTEGLDKTIVASFERNNRRRFVLIHKSQYTSNASIDAEVKYFEHRSKDIIWKCLKPILDKLADSQVPDQDWMALCLIVDDLEGRILDAAQRHFSELWEIQQEIESQPLKSDFDLRKKINTPMVEAYEAAASVIPNKILDNWYESLEHEVLDLNTLNLTRIRNLWFGERDDDIVGLIGMIRAKVDGLHNGPQEK